MGNEDDLMFPMDEIHTPESGVSTSSTVSENPFFVGIQNYRMPQTPVEDDIGPETPTTIQKNLCLNATSEMRVDLSDDENEEEKSHQKRLCVCASRPQEISQASGQPQLKESSLNFPCHTHQITDDYKISHEIIGVGESGKVMACYSKKDNKKYALKVLRDGPKSRREVHLHFLTCNHENIVSIIDIYENTFDNVKCLLVVVEFLEGGDLLTHFENQGSQPYNEEKVGRILKQIGSAVMYLHDMNIAHRDIKLENILCSSTDPENCTYKLGDFGFAKRPERNHLMESPCCTPFYAPPEVLNHDFYDKSCDMWSLGVVMYILLCGYPPFYSMKGLPFSPGMQQRITTGLYAFPPDEWDSVKETTKDEVRHLLTTDPSKRTKIYDFMKCSFITGEQSLQIPSNGSDSGLSESGSPLPGYHGDLTDSGTPDADSIGDMPLTMRTPIARRTEATMSARTFTKPIVKPPRLHSIQEEMNRALDLMRLGNDHCYIKNLKTSENNLLERLSISGYNEPVVGVPLPKRNWKRGTLGNGRILCIVHTAKPSHEIRAKTVYDTWAKNCDDVIFFTDAPMDWNVPHVYFPKFTTRKHSWEKIRNVMRFIYKTTLGQYDWYLRADDDAFVLMENARKFLRRFDPNHDYLLGYRWGFYEQKGFADGSTYILSWKALGSFVNVTYDEKLCPEFHRAEEDQELSRCLAKVGITPTDSRDNDGRDRFHQFHPEEHLNPGRELFISRHGYYRYFGYPDHVSPSTVGMHHLSPYEMRFIDFLVHKVRISSD